MRDEANVWQLERVVAEFQSVGRDTSTIPFVFQLNKRDLAEVLPVDELHRLLSMHLCAYVESVASRGQGVREALDALVHLIER